MYSPDMAGSGQYGICIHFNLGPTKEGHDGCLGTLPEDVVMNACCGHGKNSGAYIQYWDGECIRGEDAVKARRDAEIKYGFYKNHGKEGRQYAKDS